jgi:hypothetical protein
VIASQLTSRRKLLPHPLRSEVEQGGGAVQTQGEGDQRQGPEGVLLVWLHLLQVTWQPAWKS